jgi:hypothetical protein
MAPAAGSDCHSDSSVTKTNTNDEATDQYKDKYSAAKDKPLSRTSLRTRNPARGRKRTRRKLHLYASHRRARRHHRPSRQASQSPVAANTAAKPAATTEGPGSALALAWPRVTALFGPEHYTPLTPNKSVKTYSNLIAFAGQFTCKIFAKELIRCMPGIYFPSHLVIYLVYTRYIH